MLHFERLLPRLWRGASDCGRVYLVTEVSSGIVPGSRRLWRVSASDAGSDRTRLVVHARTLGEAIQLAEADSAVGRGES